MRFDTRWLRATLTVSLMLVSTACGGTPPEPARPAAPAQQAPAQVAKPDFKLGVPLPYSGVYSVLGESITNGMNLYFEEIGYVAGGRKIVMIKDDTEANPEVGARKTRKLVEQDKVDMIAGYVSSTVATGARDYLHDNKVVTVIANAGADALSRAKKSPYIFRTSFSNWQVSAATGKWAAENLGKKAVTLNPDYQAGKDNAAAFKETFQPSGGQVLADIFPPLSNSDYAPYLVKVKDQNPDVAYAFFSGSDAVRFLKQWKEYGLKNKIPLISSGFLVEEDVLANQEVAEAALGVYSALFWAYTLDTPENKAFIKAYEDKFKKSADVFSVQGYETARFIAEALNKVNGNTQDQQALLAAMKGVTFKGPRGEFRLDPQTQNIILTMYIRKVEKVGDRITNKVIATIPDWKDPGK